MPTVYLADRDVSFRKALAHSLRQRGADVATFTSGLDLYTRAIEDGPDLIVMDADLEEMNGFQVFGRLLRQPGAFPPVVFVTHFNKWGIAERLLDRGALDYLLKDRPLDEILDAVGRHLLELPRRSIAAKRHGTVAEGIAMLRALRDLSEPPIAARAPPTASVDPIGSAAERAEVPAGIPDRGVLPVRGGGPARRPGIGLRHVAASVDRAWKRSTSGVSSGAQSVADAAARLVERSRRAIAAAVVGTCRRTGEVLMAAVAGLAALARAMVTGAAGVIRWVADAALGVVREGGEIVAAAARGIRRVGARTVALMRLAVEIAAAIAGVIWGLAAASVILAGEACAAVGAALAGLAGRGLAIAAGTAARMATHARAVGTVASRSGRRTVGGSDALVRRACEAAGQAGNAFASRGRTAVAGGVTLVRRWELAVREPGPGWRGVLVRHRVLLANVVGSVALGALILMLLPDRPDLGQVVLSAVQMRPDGAGHPAAGQVPGLARREDLGREPELNAETAPAEGAENGAGDLRKGGSETSTVASPSSDLPKASEPTAIARRSSPPSNNPSLKAGFASAVGTPSRPPAALTLRPGEPRRAATPQASGSEYRATQSPFGPLGQRNEPVWRNTRRVAGTAPLRPGVIDEDRDGVPDVRPPILVKRVQPELPLEFGALAEPKAVLLGIRVGSDGLPRQVQVRRSSGYDSLDRAAVAAAFRFRWQPARGVSGPVDQWIELGISFGRRDRAS